MPDMPHWQYKHLSKNLLKPQEIKIKNKNKKMVEK